MKIRYFMITRGANSPCLAETKIPLLSLKPTSTRRKLFCLFGWFGRMFSTTSYSHQIRPSTLKNTSHSSTKLKAITAKKRQELAKRRGVVFNHDNAKPHLYLAIRNKLFASDWDFCPTSLFSEYYSVRLLFFSFSQ